MVKITEIDPDKKYILQFNEPLADFEVAEFVKRLGEMFKEGEYKIAVISGDVTIVPADQVVGYTPFEKGTNQ